MKDKRILISIIVILIGIVGIVLINTDLFKKSDEPKPQQQDPTPVETNENNYNSLLINIMEENLFNLYRKVTKMKNNY